MQKTKKIKKSVRLAPHIKPKRYTLTLKPDLENFTFIGKEIIDINLDKDTITITLHSKDIDIGSAQVVQGKSGEYASKITYDEKAETAIFTFKKKIKKGNAKLEIAFKGIISESLRGFYRSRYEINGETKHLATTQFEATDARRAFPCFDEPAHKAIFDVSLIIPGSHTAISNTMPTSVKEHEGAYKVIEFASTPRMSTYLLAFIIGEFEYVEGWTKQKSGSAPAPVQIRVFTTKGKKHQAKFALDVAIKSIEFYNEYFDIPYPLPVLDLIAIPDFESGAMENWGAVTFRESALLVDNEKSSLSNKQWVAIVVAHELAHQWFGNLVTMEWWTDLWLNEGFASYMEYLCTDYIFPEWKVWGLYLSEKFAIALRLDALANSHPIEIHVNHPNEINEIFDSISYAKGSAIIRQLAGFLGHDTFRDGLRHYLKKHSYKNTKTVDLWDSFEKVSGKNVRQLMQNWTGKTGYPIVSIDTHKKGSKITQERFFSSRISSKNNKEKTLWQIPIQYESFNGKEKDNLHMLMTKKSSPLIGTSIGKVNIGESSFMRVRYDKITLTRLKIEIEKGQMSVHDRLGIIRDLFAMAEGGYISATDALDFSLSYKNETEYIIWSEIATGVNKIYNLIREENFENLYKKYSLSLFNPMAHMLGFKAKTGENNSQVFLRNLVLSQAAHYGDKEIIREAQKIFTDRKNNPIKSDIRSVVYGIVAKNGGEKEWKLFKELYESESLHEEKDRYGRALTLFKQGKLLSKTLSYALSKNVRSQDTPSMVSGVWQNSYGRDLTWKFIKNNWKIILKDYGHGGHFLSRLLAPLGSHTDKKDAIDAKKFFAKNSAPGSERTLEQSYERIYSNDAWVKADKMKIKKWLSNL